MNITTIAIVVASLVVATLLIALLRTAVVVVTHRLEHCSIEADFAIRHNTHITNNRAVVGVLVVELVALRTHKVRHAECIIHREATGARGNLTHHLVGILAVVLKYDMRLGIVQLFGFQLQLLA